MAKQLDCTISIASTQNNGIYGSHFGHHTTFSRLSHLASKWKPGQINISGVDWRISKSNHSNQQMPCESSSLNWMLGFAMIVGLKITHTSFEHYTTGIFSNVSSSCWHMSHFGSTSKWNQCALQNLRVIECTARWTWEISGGILRINFLPERRLCQSFVQQTRLTWPIIQATSMPGHCISQLVIFENISPAHLKYSPAFLSGWSHVPWQVI